MIVVVGTGARKKGFYLYLPDARASGTVECLADPGGMTDGEQGLG